MYLVRIALRNLFRRRWRTLVTAGVLAFAILFFLLIDTFMGGMMELSFDNIIDFESAHLEVGPEEIFVDDDLPLDELFVPTERLEEKLTSMEGYQALTPVLDFTASINARGDEFPLLVRAIEPESFKEVFKNHEYVAAGNFVEAGDNQLVIGSQLAEMLELEVGDYYTLLFRDRRGSFNTIEGEIGGILSTPHPDMNLSTALISLEAARGPLGVGEEEISQLMVRMDDRGRAVAQTEELDAWLGDNGLIARSYEDAAEILVAMELWGKLETYFILGLILLVGAIGIINVIILSALERTEEIGMMKAMGLKEGEIVRVFLVEAGGIGLIGGIIGCGLGALGVAYLSTYGFRLDTLYGGVELAMGIPILGRMYGVWNPSSFVIIFFFSIAVALLASILPSYWAARKDPIKAIYHR